MPFEPLSTLAPLTAMKETWRFTLTTSMHGLKAGHYTFLEFYCNEADCDCRRVLLKVIYQPTWPNSSVEPADLATIGFGWETPAFYQKWSRDAPDAHEFAGARLEPLHPQSPQAEAVLHLTQSAILRPPEHVLRIKQHYAAARKGLLSRN